MTYKIQPSALSGKIAIPPSKSHTMRSLLFGSLGHGITCIDRYLPSPDTSAMIEALRMLGVNIDQQEDRLTIKGLEGRFLPCTDVIHAGNSGQVLRFIGSLAALIPTYTVITGDMSIRNQRPIAPLLSGLNQLQAFAVSTRGNGQAPLIIKGQAQSGYAKITGEDSQPVSGLLMLSAFLPGTTHLSVTNSGETPWIDMTLWWLRRLGAAVSHENYASYTISGSLAYAGFEYTIPGDFSSAAFPIVAALVTGSTITLENLDMSDCQGDKKIIDVLIGMGARIEISYQEKTVTVFPSTLVGCIIDANPIIDAVPILAVLGCFARGTTEIRNARIARKKESDRIHVIVHELSKMGAWIEESSDGLIVHASSLVGAELFSHADHRIAMALVVAALGAQTSSCLKGWSCIQKSYPHFLADFCEIGAKIQGSHD